MVMSVRDIGQASDMRRLEREASQITRVLQFEEHHAPLRSDFASERAYEAHMLTYRRETADEQARLDFINRRMVALRKTLVAG